MRVLAGFLAVAFSGCAGTGTLSVPGPSVLPPSRCPDPEAALACYAPIVLQEHASDLDRPTRLDPDGSGRLDDDFAAWQRSPDSSAPVPFYAKAAADAERLYLFYALYYPVDWSGDPRNPRLDHFGDLEGALVVISRAKGAVEAVVTQAHRLFYLWTIEATPSPSASGRLTLTADGRPLLFSESGGHGLYAFGHGRWRPKGGRRYLNGPAAVPAERLRRFEPRELRDLAELTAFTSSPNGPFRDLAKAKPPWQWDDRRGAVAKGTIVSDPAGFYARLLKTPRP